MNIPSEPYRHVTLHIDFETRSVRSITLKPVLGFIRNTNVDLHDLAAWIPVIVDGEFTYVAWPEDDNTPDALKYGHIYAGTYPLSAIPSELELVKNAQDYIADGLKLWRAANVVETEVR